MAYNKINWENGSVRREGYVLIDGTQYQTVQPEYEGSTPINADNLNHMDNGIKEAHDLMEDSGWVDLTLQGGATPRSSDFTYKPQIRKIGKTVFLKGQVTVPAHSSALVIAVIPEDYIAGYEVPMKGFTADCWISSGGNVTVKVDNTRRDAQSLNNSWFIN